MSTDDLDRILTNTSAKGLIEFINSFTEDEPKRCRLLLAALILRMERGDKK